MDIELIKALGDLPVVAILIYLIVRTQAEKEKLLSVLVETQRCHAKDLLEIILSGKVKMTTTPPLGEDTLQS